MPLYRYLGSTEHRVALLVIKGPSTVLFPTCFYLAIACCHPHESGHRVCDYQCSSRKIGMPSDPCVLERVGMDQAWGKEDRVVMSTGRPATPPAIPWVLVNFLSVDVL